MHIYFLDQTYTPIRFHNNQMLIEQQFIPEVQQNADTEEEYPQFNGIFVEETNEAHVEEGELMINSEEAESNTDEHEQEYQVIKEVHFSGW